MWIVAAEKDRQGQCMCAVADFDKYLYFGKDVEVPKSAHGKSQQTITENVQFADAITVIKIYYYVLQQYN